MTTTVRRTAHQVPSQKSVSHHDTPSGAPLFIYSILACDLGRGTHCPVFPSAVRAQVARCKLPFALRPGLSQEDMIRNREITKERQKKEQKNPCPAPYPSSADAVEEGVGETAVVLTLGTQLLDLHPPLLFPLLPEFPLRCLAWCVFLSRGWHQPPTSVVQRKSRIGWLHRSSAERSRILNRSIPFPVCLRTSAHKIFCW